MTFKFYSVWNVYKQMKVMDRCAVLLPAINVVGTIFISLFTWACQDLVLAIFTNFIINIIIIIIIIITHITNIIGILINISDVIFLVVYHYR